MTKMKMKTRKQPNRIFKVVLNCVRVSNTRSRTRSVLDVNKHYTPESERALVNAAKGCAELIGDGEAQAIQDSVRRLEGWRLV